MRTHSFMGLACIALASGTIVSRGAVSDLRLVPFPKQVELREGGFDLSKTLCIALTDTEVVNKAAELLLAEIARVVGGAECAGGSPPQEDETRVLCLYSTAGPAPLELLPVPEEGWGQSYALSVNADRMLVQSSSDRGLLHGVQTLRQLIRANLDGARVPAMEVRDWPSLRYRAFQDDLTRGPSTLLSVLQREVAIGAEVKMNVFTYYMEHQFAFTKHPVIGPEGGSLTADELRRLVDLARRYGVDILGNQQSFGHFYHILKHEEYAHLRETGGILCPVKEESYQLLDDLYSEQAPVLPFPFFNVCCDETHGLGKGPSKALAEQIGVGAVYAGHLSRVHGILKERYGKRMMMWGDIILRHPEHLKLIPQDTVMLTWGYGPRESFEDQIIPFAESGYEFFVCPGVNCWSRILPDFAAAATNIRNFVRDGAKHGALGMLNTAWDDDGENFCAPNWHGILWSAECAWNASTTTLDEFERRVGAVLFGEAGDHFGQAIALLATTHSLPGWERMHDRRFWRLDTGECPVSEAASRAQARQLLEVVEPAMVHLKQAQRDARVNADVLDYFLFGAARMRLMAQRAIAFLDAARAYQGSLGAAAGSGTAADGLAQALGIMTSLRDAHLELRSTYETLWQRENKPYALSRVLSRFDQAAAFYDSVREKVAADSAAVAAGAAPSASAAPALRIVELGVRRQHPSRSAAKPLAPDTDWALPLYTHRMGLVVEAGDQARLDPPVEVRLPTRLVARASSCALVELDADSGSQRPIPSQLDRTAGGGSAADATLVFVIRGALPARASRSYLLYFGGAGQASPPAVAGVTCTDAPGGGKWVENERIKLLVGAEGGHIYRWEVKGMNGIDLTQPGESGWSGFSDLGGAQRSATNAIEVLADGPALVRLQCADPSGLTKTISVFAGMPWVEVTLNNSVGWYWEYDEARTFAPDGPTPGSFLFSDGFTGKVGRVADGTSAQMKRNRVSWSAKHRPDGLLLALLTPETKALHVVGPGGGWGGVGLEGSVPVAHFVTYGGTVAGGVKQALDTLQQTLSLRDRVSVTVCREEARE